jgi:hypothetical protein
LNNVTAGFYCDGNSEMSDFEKIPGTACVKNDLGVVVNFDLARSSYRNPGQLGLLDLAAYEVNGIRYWVRFKVLERGNESYYEIDVSYVFQEDAPIVRDPVELPRELIDRMREDLPKAYAAFGRKCLIKKYMQDEFRWVANTASVRNDLGVVVSFESGGFDINFIGYKLDGIKYIMRYDEIKLDGVWTCEINLHNPHGTYREGAFGKALPKELLDRIQEDLPKACAAYLGRKCIFRNDWPPVKKPPRFTKNSEGKFQSEDGVVVYTRSNNPRMVVYEWEGGRWLIPIKNRMVVLDLAYREGGRVASLDPVMRKQIHHDLSEAMGDGLFPPMSLEDFRESVRRFEERSKNK